MAISNEIDLIISGMHCQSCSTTIQNALKQIPGIHHTAINYANGRAKIGYDPDLIRVENIIEAINKTGYSSQLWTNSYADLKKRRQSNILFYFRYFIIASLFSIPFFIEMLLHVFGYPSRLPPIWQFCLATAVQFEAGWIFYRGSYYSILNRRGNMDLLITLGTSAAYGLSVLFFFTGHTTHLYFETSAIIITLVLLGKWMEAVTLGKASLAVEKLLQLQPRTALVDKAGTWEETAIQDICQNDLLIVRAGERIPVDGVIESGESWVDESMLTGESIPIFKSTTNKVYAGTLNQSSVLTIKALNVGSETLLSAIAQAVEKAQASRAPIQRIADRVSSFFIPAVLSISILTALGWLYFGASITTAMINAISVIVIACPCALGLAVPVVIMVASERGAQYGILFKEITALERANSLDLMIFDKTATLTTGHLSVKAIIPLKKLSITGIINIAASLEQHTLHPIGESVVNFAKQNGIMLDKVEAVSIFPSKGLSGTIRGKTYALGSEQFAKEADVNISEELLQQLSPDEQVLFLWQEKSLLGYILLADQLREKTKEALEELKKMDYTTVVLTGDRAEVAQALAKNLPIDEIKAHVLPEEKAHEVQKYKKQGYVVGMAGDGINDAPALASADVSFALGLGSDIAIEAADITLMQNNLMGIVYAIDLSRSTIKKIHQNLFFAFIYNFLSIPLAIMGFLDPIVAAGAMAMSSISVVANALSLKYWKPK